MKGLSQIVFALIVTFSWTAMSVENCCGGDEDTRPMISVSGSAEVRVKPDKAVFTFSISSQEKSIDDAVKDNDAKIKAVTQFLGESNVVADNIRTEIISIRPIFERSNSNNWKGSLFPQQLSTNLSAPPAIPVAEKKAKIKPIGYNARRQLSITITKLDTFETIYRGLIKRGVNDVGGISFQTTELRKHRDVARAKAVQAAREKAAAMADQLGAKLASVQSIREGASPGWRAPLQRSFAAFDGPALAPPGSATGATVASGLIEIQASVDVVFVLSETALNE